MDPTSLAVQWWPASWFQKTLQTAKLNNSNYNLVVVVVVVKFALACSGPWFASCRVLQGLSAQAAAQPLFVKHLSDLSDLSETGTGAVTHPF